MRKKALESIFDVANKDKRVVFVGSDLGPAVLSNFKKKFPDRFFMDGASEQHMISMASGLASEGLIPYVNTISTFLTRRCYEQIFTNLGLQNVKVRLIGNGGGVVYAPLGSTHTAIDDIAIMRSIPNMSIIVPADAVEMEKVIKETVNYSGPIYIRLAKGGDEIVTKDLYKKLTIGEIYFSDQELKKIVIFTTGITFALGLKIKSLFLKDKIRIQVVHTPTLKPLKKEKINKIIKKAKFIFSIEEHSIIGGLGSILSEIIAENRSHNITEFKRIGFPDSPLKGYGRQLDMMKKYQIDVESCYKKIKGIIKQ